jgi:hypothetical protein
MMKSVFQVHGVDAEGRVLICRKLKRRYLLGFFQKLPPCLGWRDANRRPGRALLPESRSLQVSPEARTLER